MTETNGARWSPLNIMGSVRFPSRCPSFQRKNCASCCVILSIKMKAPTIPPEWMPNSNVDLALTLFFLDCYKDTLTQHIFHTNSDANSAIKSMWTPSLTVFKGNLHYNTYGVDFSTPHIVEKKWHFTYWSKFFAETAVGSYLRISLIYRANLHLNLHIKLKTTTANLVQRLFSAEREGDYTQRVAHHYVTINQLP